MSRREEAKAERRGRILDAAETLLRREASTDFSMRELAELADVAFATTFNLFESKERLLLALFARHVRPRQLELASAEPGDDPIDHFFGFVVGALKTYTDDAELFRPLLGVALAPHADPGANAVAMGTEFWQRCLAPAYADGVLRTADHGIALARALHIAFRGALIGWARRELADEVVQRDVLHICGLLLSGAATSANRPTIDERLAEIEAMPTSDMPAGTGYLTTE